MDYIPPVKTLFCIQSITREHLELTVLTEWADNKKLNKQIITKAKCHEGNKQGGKLEDNMGVQEF